MAEILRTYKLKEMHVIDKAIEKYLREHWLLPEWDLSKIFNLKDKKREFHRQSTAAAK